jgi:hypothetical protein
MNDLEPKKIIDFTETLEGISKTISSKIFQISNNEGM